MMFQKTPGPMPTRKSVRPDNWRGLTSIDPGVIAPTAYFPLLREDAISGTITLQVKSEETVKVILNPVKVKAAAYLVPKSALPRFAGSMDLLNRSYEGQTVIDGVGAVPDWFTPLNAASLTDSGLEILDTLGIHYGAGIRTLNTDLVESYNVLVNWMRGKTSIKLAKRDVFETDLAEAFWDHRLWDYVQPSFDASAMEGTVPVEITESGRVIVGEPAGGIFVPDTKQDLKFDSLKNAYVSDATGFIANLESKFGEGTISLANIETAKQTQIFAAMRDRYKGVPEEYLVDLLMQGIRIPDSAYREPILLGMGETILGQQQRYATDGDNLDTSVSNMAAVLSMRISTPPVNPGGMVIVVMQIVPEQLFERTGDAAITYRGKVPSQNNVPDYLADYLDPQKVEIVKNEAVDVLHSDPDGVFGYAPLNYRWQRNQSRVGGKYKRPVVPAFNEDRQRIWSAEQVDPTLGEAFYLTPVPFPKSVFAITTEQPYEVFTVGNMAVRGNTVFGAKFGEDLNSYDTIMEGVDVDRIEPPIEPEVLKAQQKDEADA